MAYIGGMPKRHVSGLPVDARGRLKYAPSTEELRAMPDGEPPTEAELFGEVVESVPVWTVNQLVAYNMQRSRRARGWSQEYLGRQLERYTGKRWTNAAVSAAERSWTTGRVKRFDANELVALASIMHLPIDFFFLPPDEEDLKMTLRTSAPGDAYPHNDDSFRPMEVSSLLEKLVPDYYPLSYFDRLNEASWAHLGVGVDVPAALEGAMAEESSDERATEDDDRPFLLDVDAVDDLRQSQRSMTEEDARDMIARVMDRVLRERIDLAVDAAVKQLKEEGVQFAGDSTDLPNGDDDSEDD